MRWWLKATFGWDVVVSAVAIVAIVFGYEVRLPYPTLRGGAFESTSFAALLALVPAVMWMRVRGRAAAERGLAISRASVGILDVGYAAAIPALLALLAVAGSHGAQIALIPAIVYGATSLVAAHPRIPKETRVLPAVILLACLLVGHRDGQISAWALAIVETPSPSLLLVAMSAFVLSAGIFLAGSVPPRS